MPVQYVIYKELGLVITTGEGRVTFGECLDVQDRLLSDPNFSPTLNELVHGATTTNFDVTAEEARTLATRRMFSPHSKRAFVATRPEIFGMARLMEVYHEAHDQGTVRVFHRRDEALKWLGIPENSGLY